MPVTKYLIKYVRKRMEVGEGFNRPNWVGGNRGGGGKQRSVIVCYLLKIQKHSRWSEVYQFGATNQESNTPSDCNYPRSIVVSSNLVCSLILCERHYTRSYSLIRSLIAEDQKGEGNHSRLYIWPGQVTETYWSSHRHAGLEQTELQMRPGANLRVRNEH